MSGLSSPDIKLSIYSTVVKASFWVVPGVCPVTMSENFPLPKTSNLYSGFVLPIPTLPVIRAVLAAYLPKISLPKALRLI